LEKGMTKRILITGADGQDGQIMLRNGFYDDTEVHCLSRVRSRSSIKTLATGGGYSVQYHFADITDAKQFHEILRNIRPDFIYHFAGASSVRKSFDDPVNSVAVNGVGVGNLLESLAKLALDSRVFLSCSSEIFGDTGLELVDEKTAIRPLSPYAYGKVLALQFGDWFRDHYGMQIYTGILFNHESEFRPNSFLSKKIVSAVARQSHGSHEVLSLGLLSLQRDWSYAGDFVDGMRVLLEDGDPGNYVFASGELRSIKDWLTTAYFLANIPIRFEGHGVDEVCYRADTGAVLVDVSSEFIRNVEPSALRGDPSKIRESLNWYPESSFENMVNKMLISEDNLLVR
jgi:GDPmannose 4,6-dehydratase